MDNKLTLRQIAPGLFSNPEDQAQIQAPLQQPIADISMQDKILAGLAQNGMLDKADNALQQLPQREDFSALVNSLRNRAPVNSPEVSPAAKPNMQSLRPIEQSAAQATNQAAQKISGQIDPAQDAEDDINRIQTYRQLFGGAK